MLVLYTIAETKLLYVLIYKFSTTFSPDNRNLVIFYDFKETNNGYVIMSFFICGFVIKEINVIYVFV